MSTRKKVAPPTGADRIPKPSMGWYRVPDTGEKLRRVTTILTLGSSKGEALTMWAGNITAETAMANLPYLVSSLLDTAKREAATKWLKRAHTRKKDERADVGGAVHRVIEAHVLRQPLPAEFSAHPELAPFLRHFEAFVAEWQVEFVASEMVVGSPEYGYAGTLDYLFRSAVLAALLKLPPDTVFIGDTKTGGELDVKGVYPEAALQQAAYRRASVAWLRNGSRVPMPETHSVGMVLHLRPEGYRLVPVECGDAVFEAFRVVQANAEWASGLSKTVVGEALSPPATISEGAAA